MFLGSLSDIILFCFILYTFLKSVTIENNQKDGEVSFFQIHYIDKKTNEIVYSFPFSLRERKIGNLLRVQNKDGTPGNAPFGRIIIRNKKVNKE